MRRTCPACARRYGGLVADDCRVCAGTGTIGLGAAALHHHSPPAVARTVELYLESTVRAVPDYAARPDAVAAAVLELRTAGVITTAYDGTGTPTGHLRETTPRIAELDAHRLTRTLTGDLAPTVATLEALRPAPPVPLVDARGDLDTLPHASANGDRSLLARTLDPIDPLGPDLAVLDLDRRRQEHAARVLAGATRHLATKPAKRKATR